MCSDVNAHRLQATSAFDVTLVQEDGMSTDGYADEAGLSLFDDRHDDNEYVMDVCMR